MAKNGNNKNDLTQEAILAWADGITGVSATDSAKKLGVHRHTVSKWRNEVAEFIGQKFDVNDYKLPLYGLYGLGLNSLMTLLRKCDGPVTVAFFKGLGLFTDKQELDANYRNLSDGDLNDLEQRIVERASQRYAETGRGEGRTEAPTD